MLEYIDYWTDQIRIGKYFLKYSNCTLPIPEIEKSKIITDLSENISGLKVSDYFANQPTIFDDYDILVAAYSKDNDLCSGIFGGKWWVDNDQKYFYLWTIAIIDSAKNSPLLYNLLNEFFFRLVQEINQYPVYIFLKTYHPMVYSLTCQLSSKMGYSYYPVDNENNQKNPLLPYARVAASLVGDTSELMEDSGILKGVMKGIVDNLYKQKPLDVSPNNKSIFDKLSPNDQVLCLFKVEYCDFIDMFLDAHSMESIF